MRSGSIPALVAGGMLISVLAGCGGKKPVTSVKPGPMPVTASAEHTGSHESATTPSVAPKTGPSRKAIVATAHAKGMAAAGKMPAGARADCSGFVTAAYRAAGDPLVIPLAHRAGSQISAMLLAWVTAERRAYHQGIPALGDLVFFRDTTGSLQGKVTHVAMVEDIHSDGTVVLLHYMSGAIRRDKMNLAAPRDPARNGWLRKKRSAGEPSLAGELFVAYARME